MRLDVESISWIERGVPPPLVSHYLGPETMDVSVSDARRRISSVPRLQLADLDTDRLGVRAEP